MTGNDEKVAIDRSGLVLLRIERSLLLMVAAPAGLYDVDPADFPNMGLAGLIDAGKAVPRHVAFGLDAMDVVMRRFVLVSAYVRGTALRDPPPAPRNA